MGEREGLFEVFVADASQCHLWTKEVWSGFSLCLSWYKRARTMPHKMKLCPAFWQTGAAQRAFVGVGGFHLKAVFMPTWLFRW